MDSIKTKLQTLLLAILLSCIAEILPAQNLEIFKCTDFEVNGKGDHPEWSSISWTEIPQRKIDGAQYETKVKLAFSEKGMYFLFHCEDSLITSSMENDFDDLWKEDVVEVFLWTDSLVTIYFEYELSPNNVELPILVPNMNGTFLGWRPWNYEGDRLVRHATQISKEGPKINNWSAEFFIPFELLRPLSNVPPQSGTRWRINMYRLDYDRGVSTWAWKPVRTNFHDYESFGTVLFH